MMVRESENDGDSSVVRGVGLEPTKAFAIGTPENSDGQVWIQPQIEKFKQFCLVEQQKSSVTTKHCSEMKHFFRWLGERLVSREVLRNYLGTAFEGKSSSSYKNCLSAFKIYFRDYLGLDWLVESFRFPEKDMTIPKMPTMEEMRSFYDALEDVRDKVMFLLYASTGLRREELLFLSKEDFGFSKWMIIPSKRNSRTKHTWVTFYNGEAEEVLTKYLEARTDDNPKMFPMSRVTFKAHWKKAREKMGIYITPQRLREWFCCKMGVLGVGDRYIDAFCGRVPRSILARHYTDYSPEKLREIYEKAGLSVLS